jgi:hypothetical protein
MTKEPLVVYWAPAVDINDGSWDLLYEEPVNLYSYLMSDKNPNRGLTNYLLCPSASRKFKKSYMITQPMDSSYFYDFTDKEKPVIAPLTQGALNCNVIRPSTINAGPTIEFSLRYIFFAEESLNARFTPPMFHPAKHTKYGTTIPGDMDIGSWFRPFPLEMQLWGDSGEINFEEGEPLFYVEFDTEREIILKRFSFDQELHNYAKHCVSFYNQEYSLIKRYNRFKVTKMNEMVLKAIKENTLD